MPIWSSPPREPGPSQKRLRTKFLPDEHPYHELLSKIDSCIECRDGEMWVKDFPPHLLSRSDDVGLQAAALLTTHSNAYRLTSLKNRALSFSTLNQVVSSLLYSSELARRNLVLRQKRSMVNRWVEFLQRWVKELGKVDRKLRAARRSQARGPRPTARNSLRGPSHQAHCNLKGLPRRACLRRPTYGLRLETAC